MKHAYRQQQQWEDQGRPRSPEGFRWAAPEEAGTSFGDVLWGDGRDTWLLPDEEPFGFLARDGEGTLFVVLRGTATPPDVVKNLQVMQREVGFVEGHGRAHRGYLALYESLRGALLEAVEKHRDARRWLVVGHSLGASLSTFAAIDLTSRERERGGAPSILHYTMGSPRVGDIAFAAAYEALGVPTWRIFNTCDSIPSLPPPILGDDLFHHVGEPLPFSAHYGSSSKNHFINAYAYALEHPDQPRDPAVE